MRKLASPPPHSWQSNSPTPASGDSGTLHAAPRRTQMQGSNLSRDMRPIKPTLRSRTLPIPGSSARCRRASLRLGGKWSEEGHVGGSSPPGAVGGADWSSSSPSRLHPGREKEGKEASFRREFPPCETERTQNSQRKSAGWGELARVLH